ncbi:MAG: DUF4263 domain-containing protein [Bacteroidales bacterium]|nr:DUF4263 domain-containing protein [Bacteroidales bacterium]
MTEAEEYKIFVNKQTDKIYLSKSIDDVTETVPGKESIETIRQIRYISNVGESDQQEHIKLNDEIVLRSTPKARQEIIAKFYEDSRNLVSLQIQKFSTDSGNPHKTYFTFIGDEIWKLYSFIRNIPLIPIKGSEKQQFQENDINNIVLSKKHILQFIYEQPEIIPELIEELQKHKIKREDIIGLAHRKSQLEEFRSMLYVEGYFEGLKENSKIDKDELVWQKFFEKNTWILGYGLNYIFNSELDGKKLEQVTNGYDFKGSGKRVDLLMKTKGMINSLCFGEIKTHKTSLLKNSSYRSECWSVSDEVIGGVAQIQRTIQKSLENIRTKTEMKDNNGDLTGEQLYLYQPKSFLLVGSLSQFTADDKVNEDKFSSFELFRRNLVNPEIITFDELYERTKHIVNNPIEDI